MRAAVVMSSGHSDTEGADKVGHRRIVALGSGVVALGVLAMLATAALDAASINPRLSGEAIPARGLWLYAFSIAAVTVAVGMAAVSSRWTGTLPGRTSFAVLALLNVSVPILQTGHPSMSAMLPAIHLATALLLAVLAVVPETRLWRGHGTGHG